MEVTPEMYAWLSSQKVIDPFESFKTDIENLNNFKINQRTIDLLIGGKYMDNILKSLQDAYNKFYNLNLDYIENLNQMKEINENEEYISNSIKYTNWHMIKESLNHFGLKYPDETINNIINGDKEILMKVLTEIYELYNEVIKHTKIGNHSFDPNKFIEDGKSPLQNTTGDNNNNFTDNTSTNIYNTKTLTTMSKESKLFSNNKNNIESININKLDPNKNYELCKSPLEFFVTSICKNFKLKPRQSVALLSNNRKYFSILCNKGTKGNYEEIINWLNDLNININIINKLLKLFSDGINISYAVIGTTLCSKNDKVILNCIELLNEIESNIGNDWDWLIKEGINSFIYAIIKHENLRFELLNCLYFQIKNKIQDFFNELRKKIIDGEKKKIYEFYSSILPILKNITSDFSQELKNFLFEICFNETEDISYNISILGDAFFYFYPLEDEKTNKILNYFYDSIRNEKENIFSTSITQIFCLIERFGEVKIDYAPFLYKNLVSSLIENYNNEILREFILLNFEKFFNNHQTVPIDILLEPYIKKILDCQNYTICDILFLFNIIEHPRLTSIILIQIIKFVLKVNISNVIYSRAARLILGLIFEKQIIRKICNGNELIELTKLFSEYIKSSLNIFISNLNKIEDTSILETPFDIMNENFENVNQNLHQILVEVIYKYRKEKNKNSSSLLALLWNYDDHDEILLNLEEINRPIYEPIEIFEKKEAEKKEKEDNKNYIVKTQKLLNEMVEKRKKKEEEKKRREEEINNINFKKKGKLLLHINNNNSTGNIFNKRITNMNLAINQATENIRKKRILLNKLTEIDENQKADDIFLKHGKVVSPDKKIQIHNLEKEINMLEKIKARQLIYPEGTIIKDNKYNNKTFRGKSFYYNNDNSNNFIDLDEEEEREIKAIEGYNKQFRKNINFYFRTYSNEKTQTISKTSLLRLFRDRGFNKYIINLDELNLSIKYLFNEYLNEVGVEYQQLSHLDYLNIDLNIKKKIKLLQIGELDLDFFKRITVKLSYLVFHKTRETFTISQCYGLFLERLSLATQSDISLNLYDKFKPVLNLINEKRKEKEQFNLPPGFKIIKKEKVEYNNQLPTSIINLIGESKYISYQIINNIILNLFNSSSIESYVQINNKDIIEIDPLKIHKWSIDLTLSYINLNTDLKKEGIEVADILEEKLNLMFKGKDKDGNKILHPIEKNEIENKRNLINIEKYKDEERKKRNEELKSLIEENNRIKIERKKQELLERKKLKKEKEKEIEEIKKKFEKVEERRKKKEEENMKKKEEKEIKEKQKEEEQKKQLKVYKEILDNVKLKLKEQFELVKQRRLLLKKKQEKENYFEKRKQNPDEIKEIKDYYEFEKKLNSTMKDLIEREDIKNVLDKYKQHLKCVYEIYSKSGYNKISFFSNISIKENEFKDFLINFTILGLLITVEQMKWIFKKISSEKLKERANQSYFDYNDFILSICYLSIFSKFNEKNRKILPSDIENTTGETIDNFIQFLGFKIPFNKLEVENFINERRSMDFKNLLKLQKEIKNSEALKDIKGYNAKEHKEEENKEIKNNEEEYKEQEENNENENKDNENK